MRFRAVRRLATRCHAAACYFFDHAVFFLARLDVKVCRHARVVVDETKAKLRTITAHELGRAALGAAAVATALTGASADGIGILDRARPDFDAKGIPLGAFRAFPSVDVRINVTDNVFETDDPTESDVSFDVAPAIELRSEWSQHELELYAALLSRTYAENSSEDLTDWTIGARGRLDVRRGTAAFADISQSAEHEGRSSPDTPGNAAEPTRFTRFHSEARLETAPQPVRLLFAGGLNSYAYDATPLNGGGFISNRDRDRDEYSLRGRILLELSPGYLGFIEAAWDKRDFDLPIDRTGVNRDSTGTALNVGLEFEVVAFLQGEVFVGYLERHSGAPLQDFSGFNYGAELTWAATQLTTVRLAAARVLNDTTIAGASISSDNRFSITIDHELRRNVLLQGGVRLVDSEFEGTPREDTYVAAHFGATYLFNRNLSASAQYEHRERDSNAFGEDFSEDKFSVGLHVQL